MKRHDNNNPLLFDLTPDPPAEPVSASPAPAPPVEVAHRHRVKGTCVETVLFSSKRVAVREGPVEIEIGFQGTHFVYQDGGLAFTFNPDQADRFVRHISFSE